MMEMSPTSKMLYKELLAVLRSIGPFQVEVKKTSIHLVRKSAFAGVHPRKLGLLVTIKAAKLIRSPRIVKAEQVEEPLASGGETGDRGRNRRATGRLDARGLRPLSLIGKETAPRRFRGGNLKA